MKKTVALILSLLMACCLLTGCDDNAQVEPAELTYYDTFSTEGQEFNKNLFYRNDLNTWTADPSVIAITEGAEKGWFYMYGTSDDIGCSGYQSYRSKDLVNWECTGVAFNPDGDDWCHYSCWAPEVIYDDGVYYMFFNAQYNGEGMNVLQMSLATSTNPGGPFTLWTGTVPAGTYADGTAYEAYEVTNKTPLIDFRRMPSDHPLYDGVIKAIDASPFIDDNGDKYLYFCHDLGGGGTSYYGKSEIWGMKMIDWHTPDYSTVTRLTRTGYTMVEGGDDINEGSVNEGAFMIKHDGKYYLTFSVNNFEQKGYQVRQAIGNSPLGPFEKVAINKGGIVIMAEDASDYMSGTGHHVFVRAGDEMFIAYHAHINRTTGSGQRAIAIDRISFVSNGEVDVIHANGPSYNLQPLPSTVSGYKNIASQATITSDNTKSGSNVKYLNDGLIANNNLEIIPEYVANAGRTKITLTFKKYMTVRALMIYNSYWYSDSFVQIGLVEFECKKGNVVGTAFIRNLKFDWAHLGGESYMNIGGAAIAEFDDLLVKSITVTVIAPEGAEQLGINEIVVLGK